MISFVAAQATTYRVTFDANKQQKTSFTIVVNNDRVTIANKTYALQRYGYIHNDDSGMDFESYAYSQDRRMFCVSTTPITVELNKTTRVSGYMILIDNKCYLADKVK